MEIITIDYKANFFNHFKPVFDNEVVEYGWRMVNGLGLYGVMGESEILDFAFEKMNVRSLYLKNKWAWDIDKY